MYPESFPAKRFALWATLSLHKKRVERAKSVIAEALSKNLSWYVACSAGKDSVVLAHMVNEMSPGIEIWSEKDDMDFPGEHEYIQEIAQQYNWNINIVSPHVSLWSELEKQDICEDLHSKGVSFSDENFYALITQQEERFDGVFLGLRADESIGRCKNFKKRGHLYCRKNKKHTCIPLSTWQADDIFAYCVERQIPLLDVYYKTKFHNGDPTQIRKAWVLPSARASSGHCVWLKYYYPELFDRLAKISPEVLQYV